MSQIKWYMLKKNKCPKCGKALTYSSSTINDTGNIESLITCVCGFSISEQRFGEIVAGIVTRDIEGDYQNIKVEDL